MTPKQFNIIPSFLALLLTSLSTLTLGCNSYTSVDSRVEKSISDYEAASTEIITQLNNVLKAYSRDSSLKNSVTIVSNHTIENQTLDLKATGKLCMDSLVDYIFVNTDSSICFNLKNSHGFNTYRHFIMFDPKNGQGNFDFVMTHSYEIVDKKKLMKNWTYVIIKQFFD